jgi:hypothetical protein
VSRRMLKASLWQNGLRREVHVTDSRMRQQLLPVPPQQLLSYLRLKLDLYRLKILHPALRGDERVVGAEEKTILQACSRFPQQGIGYVTW